MDFYQTLGVSETATQDEIKRAYRKLAAQHHPDKGGDTAKFQAISQAYDTLGDQPKRAQYDAQRNNPSGGNTFHFTSGDFNEVFGQMFGGHGPFGNGPFSAFHQAHRQQVPKKNRDLTIRVKISLKQSYTGTELEASFQTPSGKKENVVIKIPAGIQAGQTIKYHGLGDDSEPNLPRGDLNVSVIVETAKNYARRDNDLLVYVIINPIEAMIGCTKQIENLDETQLNVNIPPGIQHGAEYVTTGLGFSNLKGSRGNLITVIGVEIPSITDPSIKEKLEQINVRINSM